MLHVMNLSCPLRICISLLLNFCVITVRIVRGRELNLTESTLLPWLSPGISADKPSVFCDANEYGKDLIAADCRDAITGIGRSRRLMRFAERTAGQETWDVGLPFRQIGSKDATYRKSSFTSQRHIAI